MQKHGTSIIYRASKSNCEDRRNLPALRHKDQGVQTRYKHSNREDNKTNNIKTRAGTHQGEESGNCNVGRHTGTNSRPSVGVGSQKCGKSNSVRSAQASAHPQMYSRRYPKSERLAPKPTQREKIKEAGCSASCSHHRCNEPSGDHRHTCHVSPCQTPTACTYA